MRKITHQEVFDRCEKVAIQVIDTFTDQKSLTCYPVPRGGVPAAYALGEAMLARGVLLQIVDTPEECHFILDDLIDSGSTADSYFEKHDGKTFISLFSKRPCDDDLEPDEWVVFPWEDGKSGEDGAEDIPLRLLQYMGEDPTRGGLKETPARFLKAWKHWTSGYVMDVAETLKTFKDGADKYDEMVLVKNIPAYSKCEHHLADIFGVAHVAYIPNGQIVGLSKLNRIVDLFGRRLQVQERWTVQIASALMEHLEPKGVAVVLECRHMCMESRGICQQGHSTTTSAMLGAFKDEHDTRMEFLELIKR